MEVQGLLLNGAAVFQVKASPNCELTRVSYGTYDPDDGVWRFPAFYPFGQVVAKDIKTVFPYAVWTPEALISLRAADQDEEAWLASRVAWVDGESPPLEVPQGFFPEAFPPYNHQRMGIARVAHWVRTWFIWDMGTGKTRTVLDGLRLLAEQGKFRRALVLAPPVVLDGWMEETARVSQGMWSAVRWDGSEKAHEKALTAQVVLASYARTYRASLVTYDHPQFGPQEIFSPERSRLLDLGYDVIVADESHNLGNLDSRQTQAALQLSARATRRILLTGTPGDTPDKIYAQMRFLAPWLMPMDQVKFKQRYHVYAPGSKKILVGYQNLGELNAQVDTVADRLKKKECLGLPPMTIVDVPFTLGARQQARYNEMVAEMRASVSPVLDILSADRDDTDAPEVLFQIPHGAARLNKLLQLTSGFLFEGVDLGVCDSCPRMETCVAEEIRPYTRKCPIYPTRPKKRTLRDVENPKLEVFSSLIQQILEEDPTNKVLCWGCYDPELDDMEAAVAKLKVKSVRLDGSSSGRSGEIVAAIRDDPECRVLIGAISAGVGINLQRANYAIVYSMPWKLIQYLQALDRNNRPGQTRNMTVYRLLTPKGSGVADRMVEAASRFKATVGYTMVELIACASCPRSAACSLDGTVPFSQNCTYASSVTRPVAKVGLLT